PDRNEAQRPPALGRLGHHRRCHRGRPHRRHTSRDELPPRQIHHVLPWAHTPTTRPFTAFPPPLTLVLSPSGGEGTPCGRTRGRSNHGPRHDPRVRTLPSG